MRGSLWRKASFQVTKCRHATICEAHLCISSVMTHSHWHASALKHLKCKGKVALCPFSPPSIIHRAALQSCKLMRHYKLQSVHNERHIIKYHTLAGTLSGNSFKGSRWEMWGEGAHTLKLLIRMQGQLDSCLCRWECLSRSTTSGAREEMRSVCKPKGGLGLHRKDILLTFLAFIATQGTVQ